LVGAGQSRSGPRRKNAANLLAGRIKSNSKSAVLRKKDLFYQAEQLPVAAVIRPDQPRPAFSFNL
jgi:hypothetical protein